jgi:hypothetical protein
MKRTEQLIKVAEKFEKKYSIVITAQSDTTEEEIKEDLSRQFGEVIRRIQAARISVTLTLGRAGNYLEANPVIIKSWKWSSNTDPGTAQTFERQFIEPAKNYIQKMPYKGLGPWDITF